MQQCIYCSKNFEAAHGQGEHVIPAAMGTFKLLPTLRSVCVICNNDLSRLDEVILRCGPESYLLRVTNPPRRRRKKHLATAGASGLAPPQHTVNVGGIPLLCWVTDATKRMMDIPNQLVVWNEDGDIEHIILYKGMTAESVRAKIEQHTASSTPPIHKYTSEEDEPWINQLLTELWPGVSVQDHVVHEPGLHENLPGRMECELDVQYFRAIAKIAFHYFLVYNPQYTGREAQFNHIRSFILNGGSHTPYFRSPMTSPVYFGIPYGHCDEGTTASGEQWRHVLAFDTTTPYCIVLVQLFIGPGCVGVQYYIALNTDPFLAPQNPQSMLHELVWDASSELSGYVQASAFHIDAGHESITCSAYDGYRIYTAYKDVL